MRLVRWQVVLGLWLWIAGGCAGPPPVADATGIADTDIVTVMSFNIRNGRANDGENSWPYRRELVSEVIRQSKADILGLQEAFGFQLDQLAKDLSFYTQVGQGRAGGVNDEYCAILYRTDRFEALDFGTFWLSDTPEKVSRHWGNALLRICTWVHLKDRHTGQGCYVFNTHWDHRAQVARVNSAKLIRQRIASRLTADPVIVLGDLNAGEDNPAIALLKAKAGPDPLVDTFRLLHPDATGVGTFHGGFSGRVDGAKIDYVLVGPGIDTLSAQIDTAPRNGRYPSDHYPVTATLRLKPAGVPGGQ